MFGIGGFELFIILLFGFLIFGPDKLPEIAKTVGTAISKFKKAQDEMSAVLKSEVMEAGAESDKKPKSKTSGSSEDDSAVESFAERKARYDKERAERRRKQQLEANREAMRKSSTEHARELKQQAEAGESSAAGKDSAAVKPAITADQLYGNVPIKPAPKAKAKPAASEGVGKSEQTAKMQSKEEGE